MKENNDEKRKALDAAMSQIEKQFGKGSVMKLGEYKAMEIEAIPTGALALDIALGIGGVPRGRIKQRLLCILLQRHKKQEERQHLWTQNMRWILFMPRKLA